MECTMKTSLNCCLFVGPNCEENCEALWIFYFHSTGFTSVVSISHSERKKKNIFVKCENLFV